MSASRIYITSLKVKLLKILHTVRRMRLVFPVVVNSCSSLDFAALSSTKSYQTCGHFDADCNTTQDDLRVPSPPKPSLWLFDNNASSSYVNQACNVDAIELVEWNYEIYQNARNEQLERERRTLASDAV
ncbi:uncharacterized protein [Macrobrachium rosenbergii]|uniref:uncharacterized protein n=1 Tax=Macrobrachium rosenbergii TaxID=79674 RepID=UPI0034D411E7